MGCRTHALTLQGEPAAQFTQAPLQPLGLCHNRRKKVLTRGARLRRISPLLPLGGIGCHMAVKSNRPLLMMDRNRLKLFRLLSYPLPPDPIIYIPDCLGQYSPFLDPLHDNFGREYCR